MHVTCGIGQSIKPSHAIIEVDNDMFSGTILLGVKEFRHFFGTLRKAISESIGVALLRLDVEFILTLEIVEVSDGELQNVGLLQLRYVFLAVAL